VVAVEQTQLPVSVVIPVFNRSRLLARALRSVAAQRPRGPAEVIVVDDGSSDGSPEVAEASGARVIRHERNRGTAAAKETGMRAARHEWVAFLDSDDEWLPHHLRILWPLTPGNVLVACSCIECTPESRELGFHGALTEETTILASPAPLLHPENPIPDSATMVHRETALAAGGFRGGLCEDLDIWCRVLTRGRAALSPSVGVLYHTHSGQLSADWEGTHAAHLAIARSFSGESWWSERLVERRAGVTAWDRFRAQQRNGTRGALRHFVGVLIRHPHRIRGMVDVWRHRLAVRRRASRLGLSGGPSVAVLAGGDPAAIDEEDRYELDLSASGPAEALLRLLWRPSAMAVVSSRPQAVLARLAGVRPVRAADLGGRSATDEARTTPASSHAIRSRASSGPLRDSARETWRGAVSGTGRRRGHSARSTDLS
jgi:glycosyltransferase involved in cell wall biosynthesis